MFTLGEAAKEVGKSKTTLTRAISAGRMSGKRLEDGSYEIDPAELFRVFDRVETPETVAEVSNATQRDPIETRLQQSQDKTVTRLQSEIRELKERVEVAEDDRRQAEDDRRNEIKRVTALLTHEQETGSKASDRLAQEREQATSMARELGQLQEKIKIAEEGRAAAENEIRRLHHQVKQPKRWSLFG